MDRLLCVLGSQSRMLPSRVCGLLAERNIAVRSIQMTRLASSQQWWIQLVVSLDSTSDVELMIKRLNRLVDVEKVIDVTSEPSHQRQSMFVKVRPAAADLVHVSEVARLFAAEMIDVTTRFIILHLSASPARCEQFVALLAPYTIIEALPSAVCGIRGGSMVHHPLARPSSVPASSSRLTAVR